MSGQTPLVSVIIPARNSGPFIGRALRSALNQDYPLKEIIVVDDGSSDDTYDVARSFGSPVICVRQQHSGAAAARNRAIRESSGEFIAFLDSDDEWLAGRLSKCIRPMLDDPAIGMTYCLSRRKKADGTEVILNEEFEKHRTFPRIPWPDALQSTPATTCRRSVLERAGFFEESLSSWEDQDLWIRMAEAGGVQSIQEVLAIVYDRPDSSSKKSDTETVRECYYRVIERAFSRHPQLYEPHRKLILADYFLVWGINYYSLGQNSTARRFLLKSFSYIPTFRAFLFILRTLLPARVLGVLRKTVKP